TVGGVCPAPFDLVWDSLDDNAIPKNPEWGWQISHPGQFPDAELQCDNLRDRYQFDGYPEEIGMISTGLCSTQPLRLDNNVVDICAGFGRPGIFNYHGHVNWPYPATYEGKIFWEEKSAPGQDDEYSLNLLTPGGAGATDKNHIIDGQRTIHLEFDSDETIDHFHTAWWEGF